MNRIAVLLIILIIVMIFVGCETNGNYQSGLVYRSYYDHNMYYAPLPEYHNRRINWDAYKPFSNIRVFQRNWQSPQWYDQPPQTRYQLPNVPQFSRPKPLVRYQPPINFRPPMAQPLPVSPSVPRVGGSASQIPSKPVRTPHIQTPSSPAPRAQSPQRLTPRAPSAKPNHRSP